MVLQHNVIAENMLLLVKFNGIVGTKGMIKGWTFFPHSIL